MAQHILIDNNEVKELVLKAIKDKYSLKWNVEEEKNPLSRIDLDFIKRVNKINIPKSHLKKAKVYHVEIFKPLSRLKKLLQDEKSFHFEVFEFPAICLVYWVI